MVDDSGSGQFEILAQILTSKKIGRMHARLVGEIILADDDLTEWVTSLGEPSVESWFSALEEILDHVDAYQGAWSKLKLLEVVIESGSLTPEARQALGELEASMRAAVGMYRRVVDRLRGLGDERGFE